MKLRILGLPRVKTGINFFSSFVSLQRKVMVTVQDDQNTGITDATIKVNSEEEATKTDADGKLTLANEYNIGASISIEVSKSGFKTKTESKTIEDNNGEDNTIIFSLSISNYITFEKLQSCSTEGEKSFAKFLLKPGFQMPEANCKTACTNNPLCEYYFYASGVPLGTCYCGDLDGVNPQSVSLTERVDVYLKDASKATNEAFDSCGETTSSGNVHVPSPKKSQSMDGT